VAKIEGMKPEAGQELYDVSEKVFPDLKAEPGEEAWIFMHTVPYEGSVGLVNLLTATRCDLLGALAPQVRAQPEAAAIDVAAVAVRHLAIEVDAKLGDEALLAVDLHALELGRRGEVAAAFEAVGHVDRCST
jgi:hypothetical protein